MAPLSCPKCGVPSRGVCVDCYIHANPITVKQENFKECSDCGISFFKGKWYEDRPELLMDVARKSVVASSGMKAKVAEVEGETRTGKLYLKASLECAYEGSAFQRTLEWFIIPQKMKCDTCKKQGSGYYEAILQVRDDVEIVLDERKVGGMEKVRGGIDYYMIDMEYARQKMSEMVSRGYLVKTSSKLYGKKNGKDTFRMYYSLKKPDFVKGDFLEYAGRLYLVTDIGKDVKLIGMPGGKQTSVTMHRLADAKVVARAGEVRRAHITELRRDGMQIMDSLDCETHDIPLKDGAESGEELEYVRLKGKIHLLPSKESG